MESGRTALAGRGTTVGPVTGGLDRRVDADRYSYMTPIQGVRRGIIRRPLY